MPALRAFISYGHAPEDKKAASWVARSLEENGLEVWWDEKLRAEAGGDLNDEICNEIDAADYFVALISGMSLSSDYCRAEIIRAMAKDRPIVRLDLEPVETDHLPGVLLPLISQTLGVADLASVDQTAWPSRLANAAAERGLKLTTLVADPLDLGPQSRIVRPNYLRLRAESAAEWRVTLDRLVSAQSLAPENGFALLNLSLLRLYMGNSEQALTDAEAALRQLPREPDAHFAVALALCASQPRARRSKPEVDRILDVLSNARRIEGAGAHLFLLAAAVTANFYRQRYLSEPVGVEQLLEAGLEAVVFDREENLRCWDVEPIDQAQLTAPIEILLRRYGLPGD